MGDLLETGSTVADVGEQMNWYHIPGPVGFLNDCIRQTVKDYGHYNVLQTVSRALIVAGEGQAISKVSEEMGDAAGLSAIEVGGPPLTIATGLATYLLVNRLGSQTADYLNENYVFPFLSLSN